METKSINNSRMDNNLFDSGNNNHNLPPHTGIFLGSIFAVLNYFLGWINSIHPISQYNVVQQFIINIIQALFVGGVGALGAYCVRKLISKYDKKINND